MLILNPGEEPQEGDPHRWKIKWWGRTFRLTPKIPIFKDEALHGKDKWLPKDVLPLLERRLLIEQFHNDPEHDFSGRHFPAGEVPVFTSKVKAAMKGLAPVTYYCFMGVGGVPLHCDQGSDIDLEEMVPFCIAIKTKCVIPQYRRGGRGHTGNNISALHFLAQVPGKGLFEESMEPGVGVIFDGKSHHGLTTSMGYYLLCGLARECAWDKP
jgi:hypothetical protein